MSLRALLEEYRDLFPMVRGLLNFCLYDVAVAESETLPFEELEALRRHREARDRNLREIKQYYSCRKK